MILKKTTYFLLLASVILISCTNEKTQKTESDIIIENESLLINKATEQIRPQLNLEKDTITIVLEYYGWACPCPQWITTENGSIYNSNPKKKNLNLFWNITPAFDSLPSPFSLKNDMKKLRFEFKGQFYVEPQFVGEEGEQRPAKTLSYYSVKHKE
jgi:hypothetical protein